MSDLQDGYYLYMPDGKFGGALTHVSDGRVKILLMQGLDALTTMKTLSHRALRLESVVPDESITAEALKREGFYQDENDTTSWFFPGRKLHVRISPFTVVYIGPFGSNTRLPNVTTMRQVRELMIMLGGRE